MKKEELPQDPSSFLNITREVCYVQNSDLHYETGLSTGWAVKTDALKITWDEINERIEKAHIEVVEGRKSPLYFYMVKHLMDISILSAYTGFWILSVKRHLKPNVFKRLSREKLKIYAAIFNISVDDLLNNVCK